MKLVKRSSDLLAGLAALVHMVIQPDVFLAAATDNDVAQTSLTIEYTVIEPAPRAWDVQFRAVQVNHCATHLPAA